MTDTATEEKTSEQDDEQKFRRSRGSLESDVKMICDKFVTGEVKLGDEENLTPHRIAKLIKDSESLDAPPSVGAVSAVLTRWEKIGFAAVEYKPFRFIDYTQAGRDDGLTALKAAAAAEMRAQKAAAKEAAKSDKASESNGAGGDDGDEG